MRGNIKKHGPGIYGDQDNDVRVTIDMSVKYRGTEYYPLSNGKFMPRHLYDRSLGGGPCVRPEYEVDLPANVWKA